MSVKLTAGKHKKRMKAIRKAIDALNEAVESSAEHEKYYLESAASYASKLDSGESYEGEHKSTSSSYLQCQRSAKLFTAIREIALAELCEMNALRERAMEEYGALTTAQKKRPFCSFF